MADSTSQPDIGQRLISGDETALEAALRAWPASQSDPATKVLRTTNRFRFRGHPGGSTLPNVAVPETLRLFASIAASLVLPHRRKRNSRRAAAWLAKARQLEVAFEPLALSAVIDHRTLDRPADNELPDEVRLGSAPSIKNELRTVRPIGDDLVEVLKLLSETQRKILLADAESTDGKVASQDLASELGIPASTIRVYRRRALEKVRSEMDRRGWEQNT